MNYHKDNGLLNMIRRTDPMIIYVNFQLMLLLIILDDITNLLSLNYDCR